MARLANHPMDSCCYLLFSSTDEDGVQDHHYVFRSFWDARTAALALISELEAVPARDTYALMGCDANGAYWENPDGNYVGISRVAVGDLRGWQAARAAGTK